MRKEETVQRVWNVASLALALCLVLPALAGAEEAPAPEQVDMQKMMERVRTLTQPGRQHKELGRFLGEWTTEFKITMAGVDMPADKGTATFSWLMEGRWLKMEGRGTQMGMPAQTFMILGYDNFKMSYVTAGVSSVDTALTTSEGDMDPGGKALITYGTLDEYTTGEHDKMVRYVWRFPTEDKILLEIHDLPIGEKNTKVVEITFDRKK